MSKFKVSKTARSTHIGSYHFDKEIALSAKQMAGYEYHVYRKVANIWVKIV